MEDEDDLMLCHCKVLERRKTSEDSLKKAIKTYSDLISKLENEPSNILETMLCHACNQIPRQEDQQTTARMKALSLAYNERGQLKYLLVCFDDAIQDYSKAIRLHPNAISFYNRGQVYYRLGRQLNTNVQKNIKPVFYIADSYQECAGVANLDYG